MLKLLRYLQLFCNYIDCRPPGSSVPWTARRSKQSILKKTSPEYSLEGLMLKLKLQYFGHLIWRPDSLEKTLMLRKIEGRRRRGWQRMRWLEWTWVWASSRELVMDREAWRAVVHGVGKSSNEWLNWAESINITPQHCHSICQAAGLGVSNRKT